MILETQRLIVRPLSEQELSLYLLPDESLEKALGLKAAARTVSSRVMQVIQLKILPAMREAGRNSLYYTFWTVIDKEKEVMVADLCFKGQPNEAGEVEIGYGTYPAFQGHGYMSEAVGAITAWAFRQQGVHAVLANTDPDNLASQRVLEKNGFVKQAHAVDNIHWRLEKVNYKTITGSALSIESSK